MFVPRKISSFPAYAVVSISTSGYTLWEFADYTIDEAIAVTLSSKVYLVVFVNALIFLTALVGKILEYSFFKKFSDQEKQTAFDDTVQYTLYKVVFVGVILSESEPRELIIWLVWFGVIGFLKVFQRISSLRLEVYSATPEVSRSAHVRIAALLFAILGVNILWFFLCLVLFSSAGVNILLLLIFECLVLFVEVLQTLYNYFVNFRVFSGIGGYFNDMLWTAAF